MRRKSPAWRKAQLTGPRIIVRFSTERVAADGEMQQRKGAKMQWHKPGQRLMRAIYLTVGLFFTGIAFVGIFLPVVPTVPFLILAAAFFARSSVQLEAWLMSHRHFGPLLTDWRLRGAIPMRGKLMALGGSALGLGLFVTLRDPTLWQTALVAALIATGIGYVFSRPTA